MANYHKRLLNFPEELQSNIHKYVEYFVKFYGEERRKVIEDKLSKILYVGYIQPEAKLSFIRTIKKNTTIDIEEKYLKKIGSTLNREDVFEDTSFEYENIITMYFYSQFVEQFMMTPEERINNFIETGTKVIKDYIPEFTKEELEEMYKTGKVLDKYKSVKPWILSNIENYINPDNIEKKMKDLFQSSLSLLKKYIPNITYENYKEKFKEPIIKELNKIALVYPEMKQEYIDSTKDIKKSLEEVEREKQTNEIISTKYYRAFILNHLEWVPEKNREFIKDYLENDKTHYKVESYLRSIFGYSIDSECILDAFSEEAENILKDENKAQWRKDYIKENREKYKELFENIPFPTKEQIEELKKDRNKYINQRNISVFLSIPENKKIRSKITNFDFLDKDDSFNAALFHGRSGTMINPNIVKTENGYDVYTLLLVRARDINRNDHDIVHELNHINELSLKEVNEEGYSLYCGWDIVKERFDKELTKDINTLDEKNDRRDYEYFNEIINELIAQDICELMHKDNVFVLDEENKAEYKNLTSYENVWFIVKDFYIEFKQAIINSRMDGNIQIIWDEVGKENFDALNDLVKKYFAYFGEKNINNVLVNISKNVETEDTKLYKQLEREAQDIFNKMKTYKMLKENDNRETIDIGYKKD